MRSERRLATLEKRQGDSHWAAYINSLDDDDLEQLERIVMGLPVPMTESDIETLPDEERNFLFRLSAQSGIN